MRLLFCILILFSSIGSLLAEPYAVDAWTLHLWHLDEKAAPFHDEVKDGLDLKGLLYGARAEQKSMEGFGTCVTMIPESSNHKELGGMMLHAVKADNGAADNAPDTFLYTGEDGAFTLEAVVRFDKPLDQLKGIAGDVVTMDGEWKNRMFNFRVQKGGFLDFVAMGGETGGQVGGAMAAIPLTGEDAFTTTDWFHLAVTYDGNAGVTNNVKLYWTRLDKPKHVAHLIGKGTMMQSISGTSDFAIGNEGRAPEGEEPFAGRIDEVRISSVARDATDFFFVDQKLRISPQQLQERGQITSPLKIQLDNVAVDGVLHSLHKEKSLSFPSGVNQLDFHYGLAEESQNIPAVMRCRLKGSDGEWQESRVGMALMFEVLDENERVISQLVQQVNQSSKGWETCVEDSKFTDRAEPLYVPGNGRSLRVTISSGVNENTGNLLIDNLRIATKVKDQEKVRVLLAEQFNKGEKIHNLEGVPEGWKRGGSSPLIACLAQMPTRVALALMDGDQESGGMWTQEISLGKVPSTGMTLMLQWQELFHVIGATQRRATYINLPPGNYEFQVSTAADSPEMCSDFATLPFSIEKPLWAKTSVRISAITLLLGSLAYGFIIQQRARSAKKLAALRLQNAVANDRARIARDMHDDLGTRISMMTMNTALAKRDLEKSPTNVSQRLDQLDQAARELVSAMNDMVWSVDPKNDTLNHLAEHLSHLAENMFRDSSVKLHLDIPTQLPHVVLHSDYRHHVILSVKEAMHNTLRHAGACELFFTLRISDDTLTIDLRDTGKGFDTSTPEAGNGLGNFVQRMKQIGGTCHVESFTDAGKNGTHISFLCPLHSTNSFP